MDCSPPGLPVHHQLLELAQAHVHQVGDAIQPSHPLSFPFSPTFNLSQNQGLFQCVLKTYILHPLLPFSIQLEHTSFQLSILTQQRRYFPVSLQRAATGQTSNQYFKQRCHVASRKLSRRTNGMSILFPGTWKTGHHLKPNKDQSLA